MPKTRFQQRIEKLTLELEALPHSEFLPEDKLKSKFYPFSNERNLGEPLEELRTLPIEPRTNAIRVAVLIGESSFGSILPELLPHCDLVVFADINPYLMLHTRRLHALLTTSITMTGFERSYQKVRKDPIFDSFEANESTPDLEMRIKTLGKDHFLSSKSRFVQCQLAVQTMKVAFCHTNLFVENDRIAFFECLKKHHAEIIFFNATNLYEWDAQKSFARILSREEWQPKGEISKLFALMNNYPIIMASLRENMRESCALSTHLFYSYQEYLTANQKTVTKLLDECFPLVKYMPQATFTPSHQSKLQQSSRIKPDSAYAGDNILAPKNPTCDLPRWLSLR